VSSLVFYFLVAALAAALALAVFPLRPVTRPFALVTALASVAGGVGVLMWPPPVDRPAREGRLLDAALPAYQFSERHQTRVCATAERIAEAIRLVEPGEVRWLGLLGGMRGVARVGSGDLRRPILESALASGFELLNDTPNELVMGAAGEFWRLKTESFGAGPAASGVPKAVFNFTIEPGPFGCQVVTTETRIYTADPTLLGKFAAYWRVIQPGSALLRRTWLDAIRTRAEAKKR